MHRKKSQCMYRSPMVSGMEFWKAPVSIKVESYPKICCEYKILMYFILCILPFVFKLKWRHKVIYTNGCPISKTHISHVCF